MNLSAYAGNGAR